MRERRGQFYLTGISLSEAVVEANSEAIVEAETLIQQECEASEAIEPTLAQIKKVANQLSNSHKKQLIDWLNNSSDNIDLTASHPYTAEVTASKSYTPEVMQKQNISQEKQSDRF